MVFRLFDDPLRRRTVETMIDLKAVISQIVFIVAVTTTGTVFSKERDVIMD